MGNTNQVVLDFYAREFDSSVWISSSLLRNCDLLVEHYDIRTAFVLFLYDRSWLIKYMDGGVSAKNCPIDPTVFKCMDHYIFPNGSVLPIEEKSMVKIRLQICDLIHETSMALETLLAANALPHTRQPAPYSTVTTAKSREQRRKGIQAINFEESNTFDKSAPLSFSIRSVKTLYLVLVGILPMFFESEQFRSVFGKLHAEQPGKYGITTSMTCKEHENRKKFLKHFVNNNDTDDLPPPKLSLLPGQAKIGPVEQFDSRRLRFDQNIYSSLHKLSQETLQLSLLSKDWLCGITTFLDRLPYAVLVSDARRENSPSGISFPIIYCNRAFEDITLYSRQEVLGKNCNFLQSKVYTEPQQVSKLAEALHSQCPIKVAITNVRKNNDPFVNLLSLRPVTNKFGVFSFVVAIMYDGTTSLEEDIPQDMLNIDCMLLVLHNMLCY
jgi:PAS domain-containing protein